MKTRYLAASAALSLIVGLTGCAAEGAATGSDSVSVNFSTAPTTLDPGWGCTIEDFILSNNLYSKLVSYGTTEGPDGTRQVDPAEMVPDVAASWEVSDDQKTYTFTLNEGITFPSGEPLDAEAVKYSLERTLEINSCSATIVNDLYVDPPLIDTVEAPDSTTVKITLNTVDPNFLQGLATASGAIFDKSAIEENGGDKKGEPNEYLASAVAGNGPFILEDYKPGSSAELVANPDYHGEQPASERISVKFVPSDPTLLLQANNGSADVTIGLGKNSAKSIEDEGQLDVVTYQRPAVQQLLMPNDKEPWNDPRVREAVSLAIPYEQILDQVAHGYGETYFGPIPPPMPGYDETASAPREQDLERAKELLDEAGLTTPVSVELDIPDSDPAAAQVATILQDELGTLGFELSVNKLGASAFTDRIYNFKSEMAIRTDGPAVFDAGYYLGYDMVCDGPFNLGQVCVDGADELLDTARSAEEGERNALYSELTEAWNAETPKVPLYLDSQPVVLGEAVDTYTWSLVPDFRTWTTK